jgi:predicted DNA-binding transcriptional regulator YafY
MRYERTLAIAGRLEKLVEMIRTGEYGTPALAEKLGVSDQTIYRDILYLRQHGYKINATKHSSGWTYGIIADPETASTRNREAEA